MDTSKYENLSGDVTHITLQYSKKIKQILKQI